MKKRLSFFLFLLTVGVANAQVEEKKLDDLIQNTLKTFDVPGMSVGVIKDGKLIYSKGFGVRSLTSKQPMDDTTLVGIASNSKGFTCTALAILADKENLIGTTKFLNTSLNFKCTTLMFPKMLP